MRAKREGDAVDAEVARLEFGINEALRVYFDSDANGAVRPYGMSERLRERYGSHAATIEAAVSQLLESVIDVPEHVRLESLETIAAFITEQTHRRRPDLSDDVCRAIGNYVSYGYR